MGLVESHSNSGLWCVAGAEMSKRKSCSGKIRETTTAVRSKTTL
jgi:hypothetical protein